MEENRQLVPVATPAPQDGKGGSQSEEDASNTRMIVIGALVLLVVIILLVVGAVFLVRADPATTAKVRDVFIIFMALESLVIGVALIILIVQIAVLTNLIQNEVKPILDSTNETVNTLRGTISFISDNAVQPVIRMNSYVAGAKRFFDLIFPGK